MLGFTWAYFKGLGAYREIYAGLKGTPADHGPSADSGEPM